MSEEEKNGLENPLVIPYLTGLYLGVNAISDAYLLLDGPNCVFFRASQVEGNHDWLAELTSIDGLHRIVDTDCTTERAAAADNRLLKERLRSLNQLEKCRLIILSAMSPVAVTGPQYDRILREEGPFEKPVVEVPPGSLRGDWLDGYENLLLSLAEKLPLEKRPLKKHRISLVGHLMDRHEGDARGNVAEMCRLLQELGLEVASVWLDGQGSEELKKVSSCGVIVSLPYGRQAAQALCARTGARLIECELPLGVGATADWLRKIAGELGLVDRAEEIISREMGRTMREIEFLLLKRFLHRRALLLGNDPYFLLALEKALRELGFVVAATAVFCHRRHLEKIPLAGVGEDKKWFVNLDLKDSSFGNEFCGQESDVVFLNSRPLHFLRGLIKRPAFVEMGFPSFHTHFFSDSPYFGFRGILKLIERTANAMAYHSCLTE